MTRPCGSTAVHTVARLLAGIAFVASIAMACAVSDPADLTPEIDPNLPKVQAPNHATPSDPADAARTSPDGSPATIVPDAAGTDGAPAIDSGVDADPIDGGTVVPVTPTIPKPSVGEVLISEIMYDPSGAEPASEWI